MEAYRDQYATLFNNGRNVIVLGISVDPDTTLINWSRQSDFPVVFVSDADATVSKQYSVYNEQNKADARHVYVIGPDGRIKFKMQPFHVLVPADYTTLDAEIDKLAPPKKEGGF
jgi:peroxiredoxin